MAEVVANAGHQAVPFSQGCKIVQFRRCYRRGLFDKHVDATLQGFKRSRTVDLGRSSAHDCVNAAVGQQVSEAGESFRARKSIGDQLCGAPIIVAYRNDLNRGQSPQTRKKVLDGVIAATNNSNSYRPLRHHVTHY